MGEGKGEGVMKRKSVLLTAALAIIGLYSFGSGERPTNLRGQVPESLKTILKQSCSLSGCHSGKYPAANLSLEANDFPAGAVDIASLEVPDLKIVVPGSPEESYLMRKVQGAPGIVGKRMPLSRDPLTEDQIRELEDWIKNLESKSADTGTPLQQDSLRGPSMPPAAASLESAGQAVRSRTIPFAKPAFWATRLVNLPTTTTLGKGEFLVRISHRFQPPVSDGWDSWFGLDGQAFTLYSFGFGITDSLTVTVGRSKLFQEWELGADWSLVEQGKKSSLPFSATVHLGGSLVTLDKPQDADWSGRFRLSALLSLAYQLNDRFSFLLVPAYSTNTDFWEPSSDGTFSLGLGGRFMVFSDLSLIAEWVPRLAGYKDFYSGWGFGLEKKIGGHVFQVFATDSIGLMAAQYLPGGDLRLRGGDFRLGFNIFRTF